MLSRRRKGKPPRPGNRPMTDAERAIIDRAKTSGCLLCLLQYEMGKMPRSLIFWMAGWDHRKRGGLRMGHLFGFASCDWHHQGYPTEGKSMDWMRENYGPSLAEGTVPFHEHFGSLRDLIEQQWARLGVDMESQFPIEFAYWQKIHGESNG